MKYIGFILLAVIIAIILLLLIAVIRTLLMPGKTSSYVAEEPEEESLALAQKLSKMIQYDTTSYTNVAEVEKFLGFHKVLEELFPNSICKYIFIIVRNIHINSIVPIRTSNTVLKRQF